MSPIMPNPIYPLLVSWCIYAQFPIQVHSYEQFLEKTGSYFANWSKLQFFTLIVSTFLAKCRSRMAKLRALSSGKIVPVMNELISSSSQEMPHVCATCVCICVCVYLQGQRLYICVFASCRGEKYLPLCFSAHFLDWTFDHLRDLSFLSMFNDPL